ncbi:PP2C family protein-serine/threonine phosphatase [Anthocerotibacter panamensis]|uniref:PP2C family protein-serine/threonine phosphatase n=1 Tax=Anthocerotibacter panamensis TaxID=2857077 RepID=UPI001C404529|nr:protein phosphatase 2C domain-containing protein [Anthocerotibacter panamensis]
MYYLATTADSRTPFPNGRYQVQSSMPLVVRDTQPGTALAPYAQMPPLSRPYQRLNAFRWAVPQVHACLNSTWFLLEDAPLTPTGEPWPRLSHAWSKADSLMRLGWLIQIGRLWDACIQESVATSLLDLDNLGVLGWQVRLFYLKPDAARPTLQQLGQCWLRLGALPPNLLPVVEDLAKGRLAQALDLLDALEALVDGPGKVEVVVGATHPGKRSNNEDTFTYDPQGRYALVCDGMGGHDGGEIGSQLALQSLEQRLSQLFYVEGTPSARQMRWSLTDSVYQANQAIYDLNRQQGRQHYRRMGTTLVACCLIGPLLHVAHVGDSRVYLIDRQHCQQLTVDDDVANLEVSMARTTSNTVAGMPNSGALTQALGIMAPNALHPTVQTFVLPEDCLVLLCTDGFCDGALVERFWEQALLPLLTQDPRAHDQALIDLALRELGGDNITFILIKYVARVRKRSITDLDL